MMRRFSHFMVLVVDFVKKLRTILTWPIFFSYLLISVPLALLVAILFDIYLYVFDPAHLPESIVKLGTLAWAIILGLVGFCGGLLASKQLNNYFKRYYTYIQNSLPTHFLRLAVVIASCMTALLIPYMQSTAPPRTPIPHTSYSGTVVINEPLTSASQRLGWVALPAERNGCAFTAAGYEVRTTQAHTQQTCLADKTNFGDFALQLEMTVKTGIVGGIWFRDQYLLRLFANSNAPTGYFDLTAITPDGSLTSLLPECDPIQTGCPVGESIAPQQAVTITIVARDTSIEMYVDAIKLKTLTSGVSTTGKIGLFAQQANGQPDSQTAVLFADMKVWTNIA